MVKDEPSRKSRKLMECMENRERKKMRMSDLESMDTAPRSSSSSSTRPEAKFKMGQSVHHFWAKWMAGATEVPRQINKKTGRPAWYSAQIQSIPMWGQSTYGGVPFEGWLYHAY
jgi:hypothetical protein